jgi:hypothetical protein
VKVAWKKRTEIAGVFINGDLFNVPDSFDKLKTKHSHNHNMQIPNESQGEVPQQFVPDLAIMLAARTVWWCPWSHLLGSWKFQRKSDQQLFSKEISVDGTVPPEPQLGLLILAWSWNFSKENRWVRLEVTIKNEFE